MPTVNINIGGREAEDYVKHFINQFLYENYQPIIDFTDAQIAGLINSLEIFLQTEIGIPNGYTIDVVLKAIEAETVVDEQEVVTRVVRNIAIAVNIT